MSDIIGSDAMSPTGYAIGSVVLIIIGLVAAAIMGFILNLAWDYVNVWTIVISFVLGLLFVLSPKFMCYQPFAYVISFITAFIYIFLFNRIMPILFGSKFTLYHSISLFGWNVKLLSLFLIVIIVVILWDLILSLILTIIGR